jgi:hypothetical protein
MGNPIEQFLNQIIINALPSINKGIQSGIKSAHLDPWGQVANGSDVLGSINLGICHASATADYSITNMRGLSSFTIESLEIVSVQPNASDPSKLDGTIAMNARFGSNLETNLGGSIEAKCGFIHPHVGISGNVEVTSVSASATGTFNASTSKGKVCMDAVTVSGFNVNYGSINIHINGLGIFNVFLKPLEDLITNILKGKIRSAITSAIKSAVNNEIKKEFPKCTNI